MKLVASITGAMAVKHTKRGHHLIGNFNTRVTRTAFMNGLTASELCYPRAASRGRSADWPDVLTCLAEIAAPIGRLAASSPISSTSHEPGHPAALIRCRQRTHTPLRCSHKSLSCLNFCAGRRRVNNPPRSSSAVALRSNLCAHNTSSVRPSPCFFRTAIIHRSQPWAPFCVAALPFPRRVRSASPSLQ